MKASLSIHEKFLDCATLVGSLYIYHILCCFRRLPSAVLSWAEMVPDLIWVPDILVPTKFGPQEIWSPRNLVPEKFGPREIWSPRDLVPEKFGPQEIWSPRNLVTA